ncbi:MAG: hypothetical protein HKP58_01145 [Desulfatitalea sp.]|nr:hypothetical protein [Desulfatitalea sp.]NNJ98992.1 hypothetical protein [Desulfatitalea sp.]
MSRIGTALTVALTVICALACAAQETKTFEYHAPDDLAPGPGVFSKENGEITVYDSKEHKSAGQQDKTDFEAFKAWQQDQAAFEAFQKWKASDKGSDEYKEFLEWKRWKAYQEWQNSK